jgi:hypothetical protein
VRDPFPICLTFGDEVPSKIRSRLAYAFRVFAAVYNHRVVEAGEGTHAIFCTYGDATVTPDHSRKVAIPARYRLRDLAASALRLSEYRYANENVYLAHGVDAKTGNPDWLAEIFEWISSSYEIGVVERDAVGRIPFASMVFEKQGISPRKAHASLLMAWLENALNGGVTETLPKAPSPLPDTEHIVVASHDIDFHYVNKATALVRLIKNLGIAFRLYRSWSYFSTSSVMILRLAAGKRVGDYLPGLIEAMKTHEFSSTIFVVSQHGHRRDPNYRLEHLLPHLSDARGKGLSVGIHGSYNSVVEAATLAPEVLALQKVTGGKSLGSRQHWLRFDSHEKLFEVLEQAELIFDSSLGFAETVGFRNAASFAFPPYNFKAEKPYPFLEIPLVLMDGNLAAACQTDGADPQGVADEVLGESRRWGWGGVAALWHNPLEPISVPEEINQVFWKCVRKQPEFKEKWMSADDFLKCCITRYHHAGLLDGVAVDA